MSANPMIESETAVPRLPTKLRTENVSMVFARDGKSMSVLEDINLEFGDGEFVCLLGPSGCGKSTLLNAIAGFLSPPAAKSVSTAKWCADPIRAASLSSRSAASFRG